LPYRQGGITRKQLIFLYTQSEKRETERYKIQAKLAGFELETQSGIKEQKPVEELQKEFKFGAPEDYAHLSDKEKSDLTKTMMGRHKVWKSGKKVLAKGKR